LLWNTARLHWNTHLSLIRQPQTPLADCYARKKPTKGAGKAICAAARKLLTIVFVMLKKNLDYWYIDDRLYNQKLRDFQQTASIFIFMDSLYVLLFLGPYFP